MVKYITVLASDISVMGGVSETPKEKLIELSKLKEILVFASSCRITPVLVLGNNKLPDEYIGALKKINHTIIVPLHLMEHYPNAIPVISSQNIHLLNGNKLYNNSILILKKEELITGNALLQKLVDLSCGDIKLLIDIDTFYETGINTFKNNLDKIRHIIFLPRAKSDMRGICLFHDEELILKNDGLNERTQMVYSYNGESALAPAYYRYDMPSLLNYYNG